MSRRVKSTNDEFTLPCNCFRLQQHAVARSCVLAAPPSLAFACMACCTRQQGCAFEQPNTLGASRSSIKADYRSLIVPQDHHSTLPRSPPWRRPRRPPCILYHSTQPPFSGLTPTATASATRPPPTADATIQSVKLTKPMLVVASERFHIWRTIPPHCTMRSRSWHICVFASATISPRLGSLLECG